MTQNFRINITQPAVDLTVEIEHGFRTKCLRLALTGRGASLTTFLGIDAVRTLRNGLDRLIADLEADNVRPATKPRCKKTVIKYKK